MEYIHRFFLRKVVKKLVKGSTKMFNITKMGAEEMDQVFGTQSVILTKGLDYTRLSYQEKCISKPVKMVYTGNLLIGRAQSLVAMSKAMANINKDGERVTLDIYCPDVLDDKTMNWLNSNGCHFRGCVKREEVQRIQQDADVVVFAESLEKRNRYSARLSFSTKLTDYFRNGKCIFAIGDKDIAPMRYLQENDCAVLATSYAEIETKLAELLADERNIQNYGKKAFACGKQNHDELKIKETFKNAFIEAVQEIDGRSLQS